MPPSQSNVVTTFTPAVAPYLYEVLWNLALSGPLTAAEIAADHNRPNSVPEWAYWDGRDVGNRLRSVRTLGLVEVDHGFWSITERGRDWMRVA